MRTSRAVAIAAAVSTLLLAYYAISWAQVTPLRERGTDFSASYVAALVLRDGDGSQLYNQQVEHARHLSLLPAGTVINLPFITPPTSALLALPLTALDPGTAFRVWSVIELLLLALAVWIAIRAGPWPASSGRSPRVATALVALAAGGTYAFLVLGQIDGVTALGLAAAYRPGERIDRPSPDSGWRSRSLPPSPTWPSGSASGWWRAGTGERSRVRWPGRRWSLRCRWCSWDRVELGGFISALGFAAGNTPGASTLGIPGLVASWLGGGTVAVVIGIAGSLLALVGCWLLGSRSRSLPAALEVSLAGAAALSLVASPHLLPHDLVILAPAFAWCAARAAAADGAPWPGLVTIRLLAAWAVLAVLTLVDTGNAAPAPPGRLVPLALVGIGVAALVLPIARMPAGTPARVALAQSGGGRGAGGSTA